MHFIIEYLDQFHLPLYQAEASYDPETEVLDIPMQSENFDFPTSQIAILRVQLESATGKEEIVKVEVI